MLGELAALASALAVGTTAVIAKYLTARVGPLPLQTMRSWFGSVLLLVAFFAMGKAAQLTQIPLFIIAMIIAGFFIGGVIGDTLYMRTLNLADASRVFPVVRGTQILLATLAAALFFDERITLAVILGAVLIMGGIYLATSPKTEVKTNPGSQPVGRMKWLPMAVVVGVCWASFWCFLKVPLTEVDSLTANAVGMPAISLMLTFLALVSGQGKNLKITRYGRRTMGLIVAIGVTGYMVANLLVLYAISLAGVSRTAILTSTTPLFVMFLSAIFLGERLTLKLGLGTVLCVGGIILVVAF